MSDMMLAWIKFAIDIEKRGYEFYKLCADKIEDQRAHELFAWLVEEEVKHEKSLQKILDEKSGNDPAKVKAAEEKFNKLGLESPMFTDEDKKKITDKNTMVMEMFNMAAHMEKKGIDLYLDLEKQQEDEALKAFFHDLALQELRHRKKIVGVSMSLLGMDPDEEGPVTKEQEEKELSAQKTILHEITLIAKNCEFTPRDIKVKKGETVILTIKAEDAPAGFRCINFQLNEYIPKGASQEYRFLADTAGEFEYFSNVPCAGGNEKMRGKLMIEGENEPDEDL